MHLEAKHADVLAESWFIGCLLYIMCYLSKPNLNEITKGSLPAFSALYDKEIEEFLYKLLDPIR